MNNPIPRRRCWPWLAALSVLLVLAAAVAIPNTRQQPQGQRAIPASTAVTITGVDLHDGTVIYSAGVYYLYGTEYGCGFQWKVAGTPWCGYGVSTATSLSGPWSAPTLLFSPTAVDPHTSLTWAAECGTNGWGCFVPRMVQRSGWGANDGVWILYFPVPYYYLHSGQSSYVAMGCNGPAGPCGYTAPSGSVHQVGATACNQDGDATFAVDAGSSRLLMVCTMANQTLNEVAMDTWGTTETSTTATGLAGLTATESPGVAYENGVWLLTYSDPNCGYCEGDPTGYATAAAGMGPWTAPPNAGWAAPAGGRRDLSGTSCGGQADTVFYDPQSGMFYEVIDLWTGTANEGSAALLFEPLVYTGGSAAPAPWQPFTPWACQ